MSSSPSPLNSDDKLWAILCHLSIFLGFGLIIPLIIYLIKKTDSPALAEQAKEALNFHISYYLYMIVCVLLMFVFIGFLLLPLVALLMAIFAIIAAISTSKGELYRYPLTIRFI